MRTPPARLALLGAGISHSRSPELYRRLLGSHIQYDLLDVSRTAELPSAAELASRYDGVSVTTPWKSHFASAAVSSARDWEAVNCLRFRGGAVEATNTDGTALRELIPAMEAAHRPHQWVLLGSGVMARVFSSVMRERGMDFIQYARAKGDQLESLDLCARHPSVGTKMVVNACGRDFTFKGNVDGTWVFWDFNYAHAGHEARLPGLCGAYVDGLGLLETQAKHAIQFWSETLSD